MDSKLYTNKDYLCTLSFLLIIRMNITVNNIEQMQSMTAAGSSAARRSMTSQSLLLATTVITAAPIIAVYPFLQKYFIKGIMIGSIKG
jgi:putative aldouronate transport system permease protein